MKQRTWWFWVAVTSVSFALACSSEKSSTTTRTDTEEPVEEDASVEDGTSADGTATDGGSTPADASTTTADVTDAGAVEDAADAAADASATDDAGPADTGSQPDVSKADVPKKVLPLDESCAGPASLPDTQRCQKCGQCAKQPVCVTPNDPTKPTKTYDNDCYAICDLMAYDGLEKIASAVPKACDACPFCPAGAVPDAKPWCVKTKSGKSIEVEKECAVKCVPDYALKPDGKTIDYYPGACKTKCSSPVAAGGGGCSFDSPFKAMPVCAKEDGKSYFSTCAMQNCDLAGCFPLNETAVSSKCAAKAMTKECDGECWDPKADAACPNACDPVCAAKGDPKVSSGDKAFHAQSFRNACVATTHGYQKLGCDGLVWDVNKEKCAATTLYNNLGCLVPVAYTDVTPVCGKRTGKDGKDEFVTFRNIAEFTYFKGLDATWQTPWLDQKCQMPCYGTCNPCPDASQAVCGDDNQTYESGCLALYYNGDKFNYKPGACKN